MRQAGRIDGVEALARRVAKEIVENDRKLVREADAALKRIRADAERRRKTRPCGDIRSLRYLFPGEGGKRLLLSFRCRRRKGHAGPHRTKADHGFMIEWGKGRREC